MKTQTQDAWDVFLRGHKIDTVFCTAGSYDAEEMRRSLINHDGYNPSIMVRRRGKQKVVREYGLPGTGTNTQRIKAIYANAAKVGQRSAQAEPSHLIVSECLTCHLPYWAEPAPIDSVSHGFCSLKCKNLFLLQRG